LTTCVLFLGHPVHKPDIKRIRRPMRMWR